jgi:hypothetical protein
MLNASNAASVAAETRPAASAAVTGTVGAAGLAAGAAAGWSMVVILIPLHGRDIEAVDSGRSRSVR